MYTDNALEVIPSGTDCTADPFYSTAIDLADGIGVGGTSPGVISPDVGTGRQLVAIVNVESYTQGSDAGTTIDVITSSASALSSPRIIGTSGQIGTGQMAAIDNNGGKEAYQPIVIRINPDHFTDIDVSAAAERYIGIQITSVTAAPAVLTVSASFAEHFQSPPAVTHHTSGFTIA